ncbi:MAG: hypothetical protein AVO33_02340 [delta proteobacterium ML8_F1]|nr:MAG: hypothetical protein AVO33_02340 [delta proteobacterium ML8_F1]
MHVARMFYQLKIVEGYSVKDRRRVLRSLREKLKRNFNFSVVMEEDPDTINLMTIHIVQINSQIKALDRSYENCLELILSSQESELIHHEFTILE